MEYKKCECGCGQDILKFDKRGREMRFKFGHHRRKDKTPPPLIPCACGCGELIPQIDGRGRYRKFVTGHTARLKTPKQIEASIKNLRKHLDKQEPPWNKGKSYTIDKCKEYSTRVSYKQAMERTYGKACMRCGWDDGPCDTHHINEKSNGGKNRIENGILICPNCHRLVHIGIISPEELLAIKATATPLVDRIIGKRSRVR